MGLEPITCNGADFKSAVYTIPPSAFEEVRIELTISAPKTDVIPLYYPSPGAEGIEPTTSCVTNKHSTTELYPHLISLQKTHIFF